MVTLNNGTLRLDIDDNARITWLENTVTGKGNVIKEPKPIFRLNLHTGANLENIAPAEAQVCHVSAESGDAVVRVSGVNAKLGRADISIEMRVRLLGDGVRFFSSIDNRSDSTVNDFYYPIVGAMKSLDGQAPMDLLWPHQLGERQRDIERVLMGYTLRESLYEMRSTYPGDLSMGWTMLECGAQHMYFACYDELFQAMTLRVKGAKTGGVSLEIDKMAFVKPGEIWTGPVCALRLYEGTWREGADEYRKWAQTWRKPIEPQDWMKRMNGYFLVINKQQYGDEMWPYDTLPELYSLAQAHGFDTLGLFGWYHTGHDNNYPDLDVSPTMGGEEGLRQGIKQVQDMGGRVTLYYQGHLMDINSPYYKQTGWKLEGRTIYGNPYYEFYPKACSSDFARYFSRRVFATVCPSCEEWHELMAKRIDWVAGFGADGALYDQIGGMSPYPCFNENHAHTRGKPSMSYTQGRLRLHSRIREQVALHEGFAFMSEHTTDAYSQFLDCMHGIAAKPSAREGGFTTGRAFPSVRVSSPHGGANARMMPELFRYTFPETMGTVRNQNPFMDERLVNYAFLYGLKFELEVRYISDQIDIRADTEPEKRAYSKAVGDLRRKYERYLLLGKFRADERILSVNAPIMAMSFVAGDGKRALALWNDSDSRQSVNISLDGLTAVRYETICGAGEGMPEALEANQVAIVEVE